MPHLHVLLPKVLLMQTSLASVLSAFASGLFHLDQLISSQQSSSTACQDKQTDKINISFASVPKIAPSSGSLTLNIFSKSGKKKQQN